MKGEVEIMADQDLQHELGYTDEQWSRFQEYTHGYGEQDENGVDLSLLRENLKLTPVERIRRLQMHHDSVLRLKHARRIQN